MATIVSDLVNAYLSQVADEHKPATALHYRKRLRPFVAKFGDRAFAQITALEFRNYVSEINRFPAGHKRAGQHKAAATRASNVIVLQLLQAFAIDLQELDKPILPKLEKPKGRRREDLPTALEVKAILKRCRPAFALIYRALRQSGARPSELVGATIADWRRDENQIVLIEHKTSESTGESRKIPVGKRLAKLLESATAGRTEGPIFLNTLRKPWTVPSLSKAFSRLRDAAKVRRTIVLYCTRHEAATKLCETHSLEDAADLLNHKNLQTTRGYVHKNRKRLQAMQDTLDDPSEPDPHSEQDSEG